MAFQFKDLTIQVRPDTGEDDDVKRSGCTPNSCPPPYGEPSPPDVPDPDVGYPRSGCTPNSCGIPPGKGDPEEGHGGVRALAALQQQLRQALEGSAPLG